MVTYAAKGTVAIAHEEDQFIYKILVKLPTREYFEVREQDGTLAAAYRGSVHIFPAELEVAKAGGYEQLELYPVCERSALLRQAYANESEAFRRAMGAWHEGGA
jgi:hypothetical protein